jgi:prevent-host-death family protein
MSKMVSISEAREQLSTFIRWARDNQGDVIIQNRGMPEVVIISYEDYALLVTARERKQREEALRKIEALAARVRQRNLDLEQADADALADEIAQEAVQTLVGKGLIRFQE